MNQLIRKFIFVFICTLSAIAAPSTMAQGFNPGKKHTIYWVKSGPTTPASQAKTIVDGNQIVVSNHDSNIAPEAALFSHTVQLSENSQPLLNTALEAATGIDEVDGATSSVIDIQIIPFGELLPATATLSRPFQMPFVTGSSIHITGIFSVEEDHSEASPINTAQAHVTFELQPESATITILVGSVTITGDLNEIAPELWSYVNSLQQDSVSDEDEEEKPEEPKIPLPNTKTFMPEFN